MKKKLTTTVVERTAPPAAGRLEIFDEYLPGFVVRITSNDVRTFVVRARVKGQASPITLTIGDVHVMTLDAARKAASAALVAMRAGTDPRDVKRAAVEADKREKRTTFSAVAEAFIAEHVSTLRTRKQAAAEIRQNLIAAWGDQPISAISDDDVADVIRELQAAKKTALARRVLAHAKRLFRWAASSARPRAERLKGNPTLALSARKDFGIVLAQRQVALTADHLRLIWRAANELGDPFGPFFHMLMLSGQRRGEVAEMMWGELDLEREQVWIIPADRMKANKVHEVPLTPAMVELLARVPRQGEYVFSTSFGKRPISGFSKVKARLDRIVAAMNGAPISQWQVHDIRRAVRTGLGAIPNVPHDVRELVIAHVPSTLVQTYDLHGYRDEKRQALTLWNQRLAAIIDPPPANVTLLRAAQ
jgi:integrase